MLCIWFDHNNIVLSFVTDINAAKCRTPASVIFCQIEVPWGHPNFQAICTHIWNIEAAVHIETYRWCQWHQEIDRNICFLRNTWESRTVNPLNLTQHKTPFFVLICSQFFFRRVTDSRCFDLDPVVWKELKIGYLKHAKLPKQSAPTSFDSMEPL